MCLVRLALVDHRQHGTTLASQPASGASGIAMRHKRNFLPIATRNRIKQRLQCRA